MKRSLLPAIFSLAVIATSCKKDDTFMQSPDKEIAELSARKYKATLNGEQEIPTHSTNGYGAFDAVYDPASKTITYKLAYMSIPETEFKPTAAHIHKGGPGVNGNNTVIFDLGPVNETSFQRTISVSAEQVADMNNGLYYVHMHSNVFPEGDIRGQITVK